MRLFSVVKGSALKTPFDETGFSCTEVNPGASPCMKVYKCVLKSHHTWKPELYSYGDKTQFFAFLTASGYVTTEDQAWNITDYAAFIPDYDKNDITIHAGLTDLEFYRYVGEMDPRYDVEKMNDYMTRLPYFCLFKDGVEYTEGHTTGVGSTVRTLSVIHHRQMGRYSLGWVVGKGPTHVGEHRHPDLDQWYFILPGGVMTYRAGGDSVHVEGGDVTYTKMNTPHSSYALEGESYNYFWVETALEGYIAD